MPKSNHFIGQPLYNQVIKLLDKSKILRISSQHRGERYIKRFDSWTDGHTLWLCSMLSLNALIHCVR